MSRVGSFPPTPKTIDAITKAVLNWQEFTFKYGDHSYTVLGGIVGVNTSGRVCLWADVIAIDGQTQTPAPLKVFDIGGLSIRIQIGRMRGQCSNDYSSILPTIETTYARGPIGDSMSPADSHTGGVAKPMSEARRRAEKLFSK